MTRPHPPSPHLGQPKGLWVLFITEMWERFSYYGMRALLVFYLVAKTTAGNGGFGWSEESATRLYGWYTGLVYLTPIIGGFLADRLLGTHRSMLIGGWIIAAGHFCLAATELFAPAVGADSFVSIVSAPGRLICFMTGLLLIILGTGLFKPCVSAMVGQLYSADDPRRDSGFTIFYMGINAGAFFSGLVAGTLGEKVGWHWGFGCAGVGMILGLIIYQIFRSRYLGGIGLPPSRQPRPLATSPSGPPPADNAGPLTRVQWERMAAALIRAVFAIAFWVAFEQAGSSLNLFAKDKTDRNLTGLAALLGPEAGKVVTPFPATWYQSVNPLAIVIFAPLFAWMWIYLARLGWRPSTPVKFAIGLVLLAGGYAVMIPAARQATGGNLAGPQWLVLVYVLHTWGELCLSPVGLSMVTRLSPARHVSLMMGLYFLTFFVANLAAGYAASAAARIEKQGGLGILGGQADFFLFLGLVPIFVAGIVLAMSKTLKRMMHGLD